MNVLKMVSIKCYFQERRRIFSFNQTHGEKTFQDIWIVEILEGLLSRVTFITKVSQVYLARGPFTQ